jgi:SAM-dependent methyltransferase
MPHEPLLYGELAGWFHLLSPPADYADEAAAYRDALLRHAPRRPRTLLELGAGGGCNALHLKQDFACTLTDVSAAMLDASRAINPECEHVVGDMRELRLGRVFDAVFVHDAVAYMTTEDDLRRAIATAAAHLGPGGVAVFAPDYIGESFRPGTDCGGEDDGDRGLRYLEWVHDREPGACTYRVDYVCVLRDGDAPVRVVHDSHLEGVFPRATWARLLAEAGFVAGHDAGRPRGDGEDDEVLVAVRG